MHEPEMYRLKYIHMYSYTGKSEKQYRFEKGKRGRESNSKAMRLSNDTHDHIIFLVAMPLPTHILLKIFSP